MDRGFVSDFDGYCLEYNEPNISDVEITHTPKSCSAAMLDDCIKLFDDAYNPLTVEEDLKPDFYANNTEWFANYLLNLGDGIQTFWKDDTLHTRWYLPAGCGRCVLHAGQGIWL